MVANNPVARYTASRMLPSLLQSGHDYTIGLIDAPE
jgi:hypothetical protein